MNRGPTGKPENNIILRYKDISTFEYINPIISHITTYLKIKYPFYIRFILKYIFEGSFSKMEHKAPLGLQKNMSNDIDRE